VGVGFHTDAAEARALAAKVADVEIGDHLNPSPSAAPA